jgi:hypothetical protein
MGIMTAFMDNKEKDTVITPFWNRASTVYHTLWSCILGNQGVAQMYELLTVLLTTLVLLNRTHKRKNIDSKIANFATCILCKTEYWMLVERFWSHIFVEQQKQEHYMNVQTDPLDNPLVTRLDQTGWEPPIELYSNWQFGLIYKPHCVFGHGSLLTQTQDLKQQSGTVANTRGNKTLYSYVLCGAWYTLFTIWQNSFLTIITMFGSNQV